MSNDNSVDAQVAEIDPNLVFETPKLIRVLRVVGGSVIGIVSSVLLVFLFTTSVDRAAEKAEADFVAAQEEIANQVPVSIMLQEKYDVPSGVLPRVLADLQEFDNMITNNINVDDLTEVTVSEKRIVFLAGNTRVFLEVSNIESVDYIEGFLEKTIRPGIIENSQDG